MKHTDPCTGVWRTKVFSHESAGKPVYRLLFSPAQSAAKDGARQLKIRKDGEEGAITVGDAIDGFIANRSLVLSPSTIAGYKAVRKNYLQSLMEVKVARLQQEQVQQAVNFDSSLHSAKTLKNAVSLLVAVIKQYRPDFVCSVKYSQRTKMDVCIPTEKQVTELIEQTKGTALGVAILLAAIAGLRRGEICALQRSDIRGNTLHINKSMVVDSDNNFHIKPPKTRAGNRVVTVPQFVIDAIYELNAEDGSAVGMSVRTLTSRWENKKRMLDIRFRFHDLRHYNASIMLALGIPDKYAMERMGHATPGMLKTVYQHIIDEKRTEMNSTVDQYFEKYDTRNEE